MITAREANDIGVKHLEESIKNGDYKDVFDHVDHVIADRSRGFRNAFFKHRHLKKLFKGEVFNFSIFREYLRSKDFTVRTFNTLFSKIEIVEW